jgi:peptidoglycan/xylan/chitin deacetylase (PgdA/CDA1 family)
MIRDVAFRALRFAGVDRLLLRRLRSGRQLAVLNLHRISDEPNPYWSPITPGAFEQLVRFLVRNCRVVGLDDDSPDDGRPRVALSFDDGYRDFVDYALPVLHRYGVRANQNVIPGCVDSGRPPWNVEIYDFLKAAPRSLIDEIDLPGLDARLEGESFSEKVTFGLALSRALKFRPHDERAPLFEELREIMARCDYEPTAMMSPEDVRAAADEHHIGAHSMAHDSMGAESDAFFEADLDGCEAWFERELGVQLDTYAFPNGSYRPEQVDVLVERGYRHILLVGEDFAEPGASVMPRLTVAGTTGSEVRLRALGLHRLWA